MLQLALINDVNLLIYKPSLLELWGLGFSNPETELFKNGYFEANQNSEICFHEIIKRVVAWYSLFLFPSLSV